MDSNIAEQIENAKFISSLETEGVTITAEEAKHKVGVKYHASGNLLVIKRVAKAVPTVMQAVRGNVSRFSPASAIRMRRYLRCCLSEYKFMVTLTYPGFFESDGAKVKEHLRRFCQEVQRWDVRTNGLSGEPHSSFWFLEFQARGAPHFHIFLNRAPGKEWVAKRWYDIVGSEDIRHFQAGTRTERLNQGRSGTISYANKYAAKAEQKLVPPGYEKVGRFWGVYGRRATLSADTFVSISDRAESKVERSVERLKSTVKRAIQDGKAEVFKKEEDVMIVILNDLATQKAVRRDISFIAMHTYKFYNLFEDAEVDFGENYHDSSLL